MRLLFGLALLLSALAGPAPARAGDLAAARAESDAYPDDYGAAARLARAAEDAGRFDLALLAWRRGVQVSAGNLESSLGEVRALSALDRIPEARRAAAAATARHPGAVRAWTLRAWTLRRQVSRSEPPPWLRPAIRAAYLRALSLDPGDRDARCGLAWTDAADGDRLGARRAFLRLAGEGERGACGREGLEATEPRLRGHASVAGTGLAFSTHPSRRGGFGLLLGGGLAWAELVHVELAVRFTSTLHAAGPPAPFGRPTLPLHADGQEELWGRATLAHAGLGFELTTAGLHESGAWTGLLGARAWATLGAAFRVEAALQRADAGTAALLGGAVRVPLPAGLSLDVGVRASSPSVPDGEVGASAHGSLRFERGGFALEVGGRGGPEHAPVRFDRFAVWNVPEALTAGAWLEGRVPLPRGFALLPSYELVRLDGGADLPVSHAHVLTLGLTFSPGGSR